MAGVVLPAALTASDGLDVLVSVQQRLEGKATSVTAGFNGPATSRATCELRSERGVADLALGAQESAPLPMGNISLSN